MSIIVKYTLKMDSVSISTEHQILHVNDCLYCEIHLICIRREPIFVDQPTHEFKNPTKYMYNFFPCYRNNTKTLGVVVVVIVW